MENQIMVLPTEVAQIAENVSVEKRNEVQTVLNHVFNGVAKMREQLDSVAVIDENDKVNMKLANTIRLGVRQVRLDAEKTFDAKRTEVQAQMLSYKTEDQLWLKAKQTMQILTKEIEENARWKEETRERFEKEQHELKIQQRLVSVGKFDSEIQRADIESMSDAAFDAFLAGVEKKYNDWQEHIRKEEEERIELEKKAVLHEQRKQLAIPYYEFWSEFEKTLHFGEQSEVDFDNFLTRVKKAKEDNDAKIEQQRIENERLKAEAEAKEKQLAEERAKAAAEKAKLEAEIKAKADAEEKARKEAEAKIIAEQKAKEAAEKKAANTPDKTKLIEFSKQIKAIQLPHVKSEEAKKIASDIENLLEKVCVFINEKAETL